MRLEVLGCDGGIGKGLRTTAFLVDDDVLIDAGSGVGELAEAALHRIEHVFLTHAHLDHIAFLPLLIDSTMERRARPVVVHATEETLRALREHVFNWKIWPDFTRIPSAEKPALRYVAVDLGGTAELGKRRFTPLPAQHTVPTVGYRLDSGQASLVFTGDTARCDAFWDVVNRIEKLKYLIIETAFGDADYSRAKTSRRGQGEDQGVRQQVTLPFAHTTAHPHLPEPPLLSSPRRAVRVRNIPEKSEEP